MLRERRRKEIFIKKIPLANAGITATHLLNEKVADFLEQHHDPHGHTVVLGGDPDQTYHVEQRDQERLHLTELNRLYVLQVLLEGHQVQVNVLSFAQSCVKTGRSGKIHQAVVHWAGCWPRLIRWKNAWENNLLMSTKHTCTLKVTHL